MCAHEINEPASNPVGGVELEDYVDKMPFKFTGDLKKVVIELGKSGLTERDQKELEEYYKKLADVRD
jgi:hypothetical protein